MDEPGREQLQEKAQRFERSDPELHREICEKIASRTDEQISSTRRSIAAAGVLRHSESAAALIDRSELIAESIVVAEGRPVLNISENRATVGFLGPESAVWAGRITAAQPLLDRVIPSVGRIEVTGHPNFTWVGTGWLVADDMIVTNRHVAAEFGRRGAQGFSFRNGVGGRSMGSRIDFLEEYQRTASLEFVVDSILWIAKSDEMDIAFLRVKRAATDALLPQPIKLASALDAEFVATIGYPARDPRVPDQELVKRIFGDVYDKKRLAPGELKDIGEDELQHDCSTLGGNSGSAVINLATGEAVGLHFAGLFMAANYAVPAPRVQGLLQQVQRGELPGVASLGADTRGTPGSIMPALPAAALPAIDGASYSFRMQIPIEITVKIGAAQATTAALAPAGAAPQDSPEAAVQLARQALANNPDIVDVRLGYRFKRGWITDERVVVVQLREKLSATQLRRAGKAMIPAQFGGLGVDVRTAPLLDQLEHVGFDASLLEALAKPGLYREPPDLKLEAVEAPMRAVFHVSPDSGFPNLKAFLGRVRQHLTATMYEWEPNHISDAIKQAMAPAGNRLKLVTQRQGTQDAVADIQDALGDKVSHRWASVGAGKLIPRAYHIKVASRDGEEFWLSSGNWKDSNQPDMDPAGDSSTLITPLRKHNREWHAIIQHAGLAELFQRYIEFDFDEAARVPLDEVREALLPDLFVPEAAFAEAALPEGRGQYFKPLTINRTLKIQPLLTPDRDSRGNRIFMQHAIRMMKKATQTLYVQNQSFNLLEENNDEFESFFGVLRDKQQAGVDVRIIFRDSREFGSGNEPALQDLLERIKDFGIDTGFVKVQRKCHTKAILVDSSEVLLGSHNLTNMGSLFNRDASLLVSDAEVAGYFERIFLFDWDTLATQDADELVGGVRLAAAGEATPAGYRRISLAEYLGES
jgi:S1-C subfamily serine protease